MKIVLIGYMGSGKSAVGRALASVLGTVFLDLDTEIEKEEEKSIATIFNEKGEIFFRKKEESTLINLLEQHNSAVIGTGGGTPCYGNVLQKLLEDTNVKTIFLKASLQTLTQRLQLEKENRPLISHIQTEVLLQDFVRKHLFERNFFYFQADSTVVVDDKTISEIVEEIVLPLF